MFLPIFPLLYFQLSVCLSALVLSGVAATHLQNKRLYPMVCSTAAKSSMKLIRSHSAPTTLQYLCCTQLRRMLPACADALRVLPLPPGLRLLLANQLGWVLTLGCADTTTKTEEGHCDQYTSLLPSHDPADTNERVFISSSFPDNPDEDDPLDSASVYIDSCSDDSHYQDAVSDETCYLEPSSPSDVCCGFVKDRTSFLNPEFQHISASCLYCDPPLSVSSGGRKVNDANSAYKPGNDGSCVLSPSYTHSGHTSFWPDSASESESDECSSDREMYQRKRCRWT